MIFTRANKAFRDYERRMLRPATWPPTKHDVPTLWERAKAMFADTLKPIGAIARLAYFYRLTHARRRELNACLRPVEKIVRILLMIEAATFLLMTPEGAAMRRDATLVAPPAPPPLRTQPSTRILMPGWHTIAALHPRIDPRAVALAEREARAREAELANTAPPDPRDPSRWRVAFPVVRWTMPPKEQAPAHTPRPMCMVLGEDTNFPVTHDIIPQKPSRPEKERLDADPSAIRLARRLEAVARVLADPTRTIRRLAQRFAALPAGMLGAPEMDDVDTRRWHHGKPEAWNASFLGIAAIKAVTAAARQRESLRLEPG